MKILTILKNSKVEIVPIGVVMLFLLQLPIVLYGQSHTYTSVPTSTRNYIRTIVAKEEGLTLTSDTQDAYKVDETIMYYDGLGRPLQSVQVAASPNFKDVVSPYEYDDVGREAKRYLSFEKSSASNGAVTGYSNVTSSLRGFYEDVLGYSVEESFFTYSYTTFEGSPLNRVVSERDPGRAWYIGSRTNAYGYGSNGLDFSIPMFEEESTNIFRFYSEYDIGELYVNSTTDENGNQMETIVDKQGRTILKKSYLSSDVNDFAITYYGYDYLGNLRLVVQPEGWQQLLMNKELSLSKTSGFVRQYCFYYEYDHRNRMIEKQVPGAEAVYMVYDSRDRLILTQDGNQRGLGEQVIVDGEDITLQGDNGEASNFKIINNGSVTLNPGFESNSFYAGEVGNDFTQWSFTKYDELNRPVLTGVVNLSASVSEVRADVESMTDGYSISLVGGSNDLYGYNNTSYPSVSGSDILTVTYYDNYNFTQNTGHWSLGDYSTEPSAKGLVTGGKTRILGEDMMESISLYDARYRVIETHVQNHLDGKDVIETEYENLINSQIVSTTRSHSGDVDAAFEVIIEEDFDYDHVGRLLTSSTSIDGGTSSVITSTYDEIGQLVEKDLNGSQSVDYTYNIRGWMTTINGGTTFDDASDKFGMELEYTAAGQYNGNIGKIEWKNVGSELGNGEQEFNYSYDGLNRLTSANYGFVNGTTAYQDYFSVSGLQYDLNGNIERLNRKFEGQSVDELVYNYQGNQLIGVEDVTNNTDLFDNGHVRPSDQESTNTIPLVTYDPGKFNHVAGINHTWDFTITSGISDIEIVMDMCTIGFPGIGFTLELYDAADPLTPVDTRDWYEACDPDEGYDNICKPVSLLHDLSMLSQGGTARLIVSGPDDNYWTEITMANVEVITTAVSSSDQSEYFYDHNGNMTEDLNKQITNIRYNYLNLPEKVDYVDPSGNSQTVTYTYDAAGMKLKKESTSGATIDYIGGIHYRDGVLDFVQHAEGRYLFASNAYQYNLTDHLGNVRATVDASGSVVQADDYYPFGLTFNSKTGDAVINKNLYKYNGKEEQRETGWLDFNTRMHDPALGRFMGIDLLSDKYAFQSPYAYAANNPIKYIDFLGMNPKGKTGDDDKDDARIQELSDMGFVGFYSEGKSGNQSSKTEETTKEGVEGGDSQSGGTPSISDMTLAGVGTSAWVGEKLSKNILNSRSGYKSGKMFPNSPSNYSKGTAKKVNGGFKVAGWALTAYSIYSTENQFSNDQIDQNRRELNHLNNGAGVLFPAYAIPIAVGDYVGQKYSNEIYNSTLESGGFIYEAMKSTIEFFGFPTGP